MSNLFLPESQALAAWWPQWTEAHDRQGGVHPAKPRPYRPTPHIEQMHVAGRNAAILRQALRGDDLEKLAARFQVSMTTVRNIINGADPDWEE